MYSVLISIPKTSKYCNKNDLNLESLQYYFQSKFPDEFICVLKPFDNDETKAKIFFESQVQFFADNSDFTIFNSINARVIERNEGIVDSVSVNKRIKLPRRCSPDEMTDICVDLEMMFSAKLDMNDGQNSGIKAVTLTACHPDVLAAAEKFLKKWTEKLTPDASENSDLDDEISTETMQQDTEILATQVSNGHAAAASATAVATYPVQPQPRRRPLFPAVALAAAASSASSASASAAASSSASARPATRSSEQLGPYDMEVRLNSRCVLVVRPLDITHLQCDMICVTTSCSLSLRYGLARQVAAIVGQELRQQCDNKIRETGANLKFGDIATCEVPASANAQFRKVLFIAMPNDKRLRLDPLEFRTSMRRLWPQLLAKIFAACDEHGVSSLAMPPAGATLPYWPDAIVDFAEALADGLHAVESRTGRLRQVTVCDVSKRSLSSLGAALLRSFGHDRCRVASSSSSSSSQRSRAAPLAGSTQPQAADPQLEAALLSRAQAASSGACCVCASDFTPDNPHTRFHCNRGQLCRQCVRRFEARDYYGNGNCVHCHQRYRPAVGNQPAGQIDQRVEPQSLPGHQGYATIVITYTLPSGKQDGRHPNPGMAYRGTQRTAYFPASPEGQAVARRIAAAFKGGVIFTVGTSATTGAENSVTWATVHHKTRREGGPDLYGYPDPGYLQRVSDELTALGY